MPQHQPMQPDVTHQSPKKDGQQAMPGSEEQFRLWIENIADIITIFQADGTIFYQSASINRLLGWQAEERIGQNIFTNPITHPDDVAVQQAFLMDAIKKPDASVTSTFRLLRKDGSHCYVEAVARNLLHHPLVQGIVTTYRDISERMELEKRKEEFFHIVNHELRTPMTSLKGHTQVLKMMLEGHGLDEPIEYLSIMERQIDRLTRLIGDLLDVTKVNSAVIDYKDTLFEVDHLVRNIVTLLRHSNPHYTIQMTGETHAILFADRDRLAQVLINLLTNAVKYSPSTQLIDVSVATVDNEVIISVRDYGCGIPVAHQQKIFERFYRVQGSENDALAGLGIGLYISKEIITRHHGKIWVESQPGHGSTFSISLPIKGYCRDY